MTVPAWPIPPDVRCIEVNGYPIAHQDRGSGTRSSWFTARFAIIGYGRFSWSPSRNDIVINVSLRYYYPERWDGDGSDFSSAQHADDLAALIEQLEIGKVNSSGSLARWCRGH